MATPVNKNPDFVELYLATQYTDGDTTLDCYAKNSTYKLTDQKTSSLITSFRCAGISRDDSDTWMGMAVSGVATNGTFQSATRYTLTLRTSDGSNPMVGLANTDDGTSADDNIIAGNKLTSLPPDSLVMIPVGSATFTEMYNSLTSISATATAEAGENLTVRNSVSLHTDGKLYKYHSTNYPNLVGIAQDTYASGATVTYDRPGKVSTGHSGLTVGATQYAENTGAITETASATTKVLGTADSATEIFVDIQNASVDEASQAQAEAGTAQGVYLSPLRGSQQVLDEDTMATNSATRPPSQRSTKEYVKSQLLLTEFSSDMSSTTRIGASGTGAQVVDSGGLQLQGTSGLYSTFAIGSSALGIASNGVFIGHKILKFTITTASFSVDDMEGFVGIVESSPDTTTLASEDSGFAGFQIKREAGTVNVYALTKEDNANMTRELIATDPASGDVFAIDFTAATSVKYYITKTGTTTLEATHSTVANIPISADTIAGWAFNGGGSGTVILGIAQTIGHTIE